MFYKELKESEIDLALFNGFDRYQEVEKSWRKEKGKWILKENVFTEQWSEDDYNSLVECLQRTVKTGGTVFGTFFNDQLIGFASVEKEFSGSEKQYLQLSSIHVSSKIRGKGIGKELFILAASKAKSLGGKKLYISAHSSKETIAFYQNLGCVEAKEYNEKLVSEEPFDCQLEYSLID